MLLQHKAHDLTVVLYCNDHKSANKVRTGHSGMYVATSIIMLREKAHEVLELLQSNCSRCTHSFILLTPVGMQAFAADIGLSPPAQKCLSASPGQSEYRPARLSFAQMD